MIEDLLARGAAYRCVCTREELEERKQKAEGRRAYDGTCRDKSYGPDCGPHTVRLRLAENADLSWDDLVFGPSGKEAAEERARTDLGMIGKSETFYQVVPASGDKMLADANIQPR